MKCAICGKEFEQHVHNQKYCSVECRRVFLKQYHKQYAKKYYARNREKICSYHRKLARGEIWFERELSSWLNDFKAGKTVSNL